MQRLVPHIDTIVREKIEGIQPDFVVPLFTMQGIQRRAVRSGKFKVLMPRSLARSARVRSASWTYSPNSRWSRRFRRPALLEPRPALTIRGHTQAVAAWAGNLKNGLDEGLAYTAQWFGIADTVTANVSTDFAALTGSTDEAKIIGDAQKRNVISAKTERAELKRRGILGPGFNEDDEEQRLAEEQQGLEPEQPMDPVSGNVIPFDQVAS